MQTRIFIFLRNQSIYSRYKWAFVPEVDTESSPVTSQLLENHQECQPHIVRIMELLKMKYGVKTLLLFFNSLFQTQDLQLFKGFFRYSLLGRGKSCPEKPLDPQNIQVGAAWDSGKTHGWAAWSLKSFPTFIFSKSSFFFLLFRTQNTPRRFPGIPNSPCWACAPSPASPSWCLFSRLCAGRSQPVPVTPKIPLQLLPWIPLAATASGSCSSWRTAWNVISWKIWRAEPHLGHSIKQIQGKLGWNSFFFFAFLRFSATVWDFFLLNYSGAGISSSCGGRKGQFGGNFSEFPVVLFGFFFSMGRI